MTAQLWGSWKRSLVLLVSLKFAVDMYVTTMTSSTTTSDQRTSSQSWEPPLDRKLSHGRLPNNKSSQQPIDNNIATQQQQQDMPSIIKNKRDNGSLEHPCDNSTSIIITTNMVPSFPSTDIIDATIQSVLRHLKGLCWYSTKIIVSIDGMNQHDIKIRYQNATARLAAFRQNLRDRQHHSNLEILQHPRRVRLARSVHLAMEHVTTEFVYVLQHDMPFLQDVDHTRLVRTMRKYPDTLRLVRFNLLANNRRKEKLEGSETCYNESTPVNNVNGLEFIKTPVWSDNNHFTRKSYYDTVHQYFLTLPEYPKAMERGLLSVSRANCSFWGTFLYGNKELGPMVGHLDGREGGGTLASATANEVKDVKR